MVCWVLHQQQVVTRHHCKSQDTHPYHSLKIMYINPHQSSLQNPGQSPWSFSQNTVHTPNNHFCKTQKYCLLTPIPPPPGLTETSRTLTLTTLSKYCYTHTPLQPPQRHTVNQAKLTYRVVIITCRFNTHLGWQPLQYNTVRPAIPLG